MTQISDEQFDQVAQILGALPPRTGFYSCPICNHGDSGNPFAKSPSHFNYTPDPHYSWREMCYCINCKTNYIIYNGT